MLCATTRSGLLAVMVLLPLALAQPARGQDTEPEPGPRRSLLGGRLGEHDVYVTVSSVQWGAPDRWSFTTRWIHELTRIRQPGEKGHNLSVSLSPGTDVGRLGLGYMMILTNDHPRFHELALFLETRAVLLRTWDHPLGAAPDRTYAGLEARASITFVFVGAGYYRNVSSSTGTASLWSVHVGIGL